MAKAKYFHPLPFLFSIDVLVQATEAAELDITSEEIESFLKSKQLFDVVAERVQDLASRKNLKTFNGVPHYNLISFGNSSNSAGTPNITAKVKLLNLEIPGAQDQEYFVSILSKLLKVSEEQLMPSSL